MYNHTQIEEKWQQVWEKNKLFLQTETQEVSDIKDKMYLLFAFAYPSGSGLHVGHVESKTALDILARYYRMNGKSVFFPVGWDAFGLPAENYAIKTGVPPVETTTNAINTFRRQLKRIGISYDWANEIATCHPGYYRWTQWLFLELFKAGLAYQDTGMVNWCPSCQTVLANEQVVDGQCERCDTRVTQKDMKQWYFKITDYQDELISGLDTVDWPAPTKSQQLHWIGKKTGAEIDFILENPQQPHFNTNFLFDEGYEEALRAGTRISCFTTRPDTVFGVTYVVMSPEKFKELKLIKQVSADKQPSVTAYIEQAFGKTEEDRQIGEKDKTGVDTGLKAINPVNGQAVPVYVADYVLGGYGTGSVMGVPAHDKRDFAFAKKQGLPMKQVVQWSDGQKFDDQRWQNFYAEAGKLMNSGEFNGETSTGALARLSEKFADAIRPQTTYKLRDWLISRQRYWGAPIPIIYDPEGNLHPVKDSHLPWILPTDVDFKPTGESPLRSSQEFQSRTEAYAAAEYADLIKEKGWAESGKGWRPEYDTMDTFVDSSWYYLRYVSARDEAEFSNPEQLQKWLPVDFYMIGPEHIVLHLLYARFFTKFLRDQGYLNFDEPFMKMRHQGMILGPDGKKMSKSKGNVINPDDVVEKFGADTLRMYEMFMGPIEADKPWSTSSVAGNYRFLNRVYKLVQSWLAVSHDQATGESDQTEAQTQRQAQEMPADLQQKLHQTIKKVSHDIPQLKFNTAIAAMMDLINVWESAVKNAGHGRVMSPDDVVAFIKILAPFAPFMAEELYHQVAPEAGVEVEESIHLDTWPDWDEELATEREVSIAVQVNGKVRGEVSVSQEQINDKVAVLAMAKAVPTVQKYLAEADLVKEIYVPGKIVSLVVR